MRYPIGIQSFEIIRTGGFVWRLMRLGILLAAVMLAVGCSGTGDDLVSPEPVVPEPEVESGDPIAFSAEQQEGQNVTRADGTPLHKYVTTFKVWGVKNMSSTTDNPVSYGDLQTVIPGYHVNWFEDSRYTTVANSNDWEYVNQQGPGEEHQTIKYWDWAAKAYRFFGVTGYQSLDTQSDPKYYKFEFPVDGTSATAIADIPYFSALWFSTGNAGEYPTRLFGNPVQLMFLRPFARVRFMFTYTFPREGVLLINPKFGPTDGTSKIARKGTFTVSYPLTGTEIAETCQSTPATGDNSGALSAFGEDYDGDGKEYTESIGGWYTVLPNTSQGSYTLSVTVNGANKSCDVPAGYMQWQPGYSYTYVFKINEQGGVQIDLVESAYTPWTPVDSNPYNVHNW